MVSYGILFFIALCSESTTSNHVVNEALCSQCVAIFAARGIYASVSLLHHECSSGATMNFVGRHFEGPR